MPSNNMYGKVVVITGGNTGIGYETAKSLAILGAHVIIACRSEERAVAAIHRMKEETCAGGRSGILVEYMHLDLASLDSVKKFTETLCERNHSLDVLINNAGISWAHYELTENGYEHHYQVNHLGHFLLTLELLPLLRKTAESTGDCRVIFIASRRHTHGVFDPNNINGELSYSRYSFYNNSKLYNVMTAYALQRRLQNSGITVSSLHPGLSDTEMTRNIADMVVVSTFVKAMKALSIGWKSAERGAATPLFVATQPELNTQICYYYVNCKIKQSSSLSRNEDVQEQLWMLSMKDVKQYLMLETYHMYCSNNTSGLSRTDSQVRRTRRHSFRMWIRQRPEDCEQLIGNTTISHHDVDSDRWTQDGEQERKPS